MDKNKLQRAAERMQEVQRLLLEAGLAPTSGTVREVEELQRKLATYASLTRAA